MSIEKWRVTGWNLLDRNALHWRRATDKWLPPDTAGGMRQTKRLLLQKYSSKCTHGWGDNALGECGNVIRVVFTIRDHCNGRHRWNGLADKMAPEADSGKGDTQNEHTANGEQRVLMAMPMADYSAR